MPDGYDLIRLTYRRMALCGSAGYGGQHYYCSCGRNAVGHSGQAYYRKIQKWLRAGKERAMSGSACNAYQIRKIYAIGGALGMVKRGEDDDLLH